MKETNPFLGGSSRLDAWAGLVASTFSVPASDILGGSRSMEAVEARGVLCLGLARSGWTLARIGKYVQRNHATVSQAITATQLRMASDGDFQRCVDDLLAAWSVSGDAGALVQAEAALAEVRSQLKELERTVDALLDKIARANRSAA